MSNYPNCTPASWLTAGQPVLVRNSDNEPWKIKLYSTFLAKDPRSSYHASRPYKVHNKTDTDRIYSFKQCKPVPVGTIRVGL